MTKQQRTTYWQDLVNEHSRSGLSVTSFCQDHQINPQRFYLWRQRFQAQAQTPMTGAFLELVPSSRSGESGIRLRLDPGLSIELDRGFDPATLKQVLAALRAPGSCLP
jgi:transposase-like protein